jgi:hypothetical protein
MVSNGKGPFPRMIHGTCRSEQLPEGSSVPQPLPGPKRCPLRASLGRRPPVKTACPCRQTHLVSGNASWTHFWNGLDVLDALGTLLQMAASALHGHSAAELGVGKNVGQLSAPDSRSNRTIAAPTTRLSACQIGQNGDAATRPNPLYTPTPWTSLESEMFTSVAICW